MIRNRKSGLSEYEIESMANTLENDPAFMANLDQKREMIMDRIRFSLGLKKQKDNNR